MFTPIFLPRAVSSGTCFVRQITVSLRISEINHTHFIGATTTTVSYVRVISFLLTHTSFTTDNNNNVTLTGDMSETEPVLGKNLLLILSSDASSNDDSSKVTKSTKKRRTGAR